MGQSWGETAAHDITYPLGEQTYRCGTVVNLGTPRGLVNLVTTLLRATDLSVASSVATLIPGCSPSAGCYIHSTAFPALLALAPYGKE